MKLVWTKLGHVYAANGESDEIYSHGKCRAFLDMGSFIRAYVICYSRLSNEGNITSRTFYIDLDKQDPTRIVKRSTKPVLRLGEPGEFDEHGIMAECVLKQDNKVLMYYDGWNRRVGVPYDWSIGLAESKDGGETFTKVSKGPILGTDQFDPYLVASPFVKQTKDGKWHIWYLGGDAWIRSKNDGKFYSIYTIKHATSSDGKLWAKDGKRCLPTVHNEECQAGATIFYHDGVHHMLFSYRPAERDAQHASTYKMGYAVSENLITWERSDNLSGLDVSARGWDSEMICYPQIVETDGQVFLFYSGNGYGKTGFGVAKLRVPL